MVNVVPNRTGDARFLAAAVFFLVPLIFNGAESDAFCDFRTATSLLLDGRIPPRSSVTPSSCSVQPPFSMPSSEGYVHSDVVPDGCGFA
ncbi:hypothetical protein BV898_18165 [Hypsibius exemplaris]|uniref:Uncharacterized protein n=1 Tax=Hypsibius exemplaris TaxID=2072580 RepID=A0A9X6NIX4_HYPEX|nr:hypothetical protein BV898_18165 [Hypsibius exemplaris]